MGKKSGGSKVKESANERALAEISMEKWNRYKNIHQGTEKAFIDEVSRDASPLLRGRAVADVAQASGASAGQAIALGGGTTSRLGATAKNVGAARIGGVVEANKTADVLKTEGRLSALKIGNDMAADAQAGLSMAARASNTESLAKARAQQTENDAVMGALGQVAGSAYSGYQNKKLYDQAERHTAAAKAKMGGSP